MMSKKTVPVLLFCLARSAHPADSEADSKLLNPTFQFQLCVRTTTDTALGSAGKLESNAARELETQVWRKVVSACYQYLGDEAKGLILLHYDGNTAKASGYYDGLVYSARAYVASKAIDHIEGR
jgi:hypothetical protein